MWYQKTVPYQHMEVSVTSLTPSYHLFIHRIFHEINHPAIGTQWIGLRENLQETIDFPIKYGAFL